jgi:hypothetical protein
MECGEKPSFLGAIAVNAVANRLAGGVLEEERRNRETR